MVPARFALAAQADGWWLRSVVIWAKGTSLSPKYAGACMPDSVKDRPVTGHEYIYLLAKSPRYFYDYLAVEEDGTDEGGKPARRRLRTVWLVNPQPYRGAHYAAWPEKLAETVIRAGTSAGGVCRTCGAPYVRLVEREAEGLEDRPYAGNGQRKADGGKGTNGIGHSTLGNQQKKVRLVLGGWRPACGCNCEESSPAVVLDPFYGSGTTLRVAARLGRDAVGVDVSSEYLSALVPQRTGNVQMELSL